jgi:hypothetical protein
MQYVEYTIARADTGAVLPYAIVTVYLSDGVTLATIYNSTGLSVIANPQTATINGMVGFSAPNNTYIIKATSADLVYTVPNIRVQVYDLSNLTADNYVTPEQYSGVGNGVANDTTPLVTAIATGKNVYLAGTYLHTTSLTMANNNQRIYGPGALKTSGAIDGIIVNGGVNGVEIAINVNSPGQTAGYAVKLSNASRVNIQKLNIIDAYGGLYAEEFNSVQVDFLWATTRGPGIKLYGDNTKLSDIIHFERAVIDPGSGFYGFDWDGAVHTVTGRIGVIGGKGNIIRNVSGGTRLPAIGRVVLESDYSEADGIRVDAGQDLDFTDAYALGAVGSGLYVGAAVAARDVRVAGGKYEGNTRYGIENLGGAILFAGNTRVIANTLGQTTGLIWTEAYRFVLDGSGYIALSSGNPLIAFDTNDFMSYNRTTNSLTVTIGSVVKSTIDSNGTTSDRFNLDGTAYWTLSSGNPLFVFDATDYMAYDRTSNGLTTYIGGVIKLTVNSNGVTSDRFNVDTNFYSTLVTSNPRTLFDANDYLSYDRTGNSLTLTINSAAAFQASSSGFGYPVGSGGVVTQITSRATGVTLNKPSGAITLVSAAGSATWNTFTVTNSNVAVTDLVDVCQKSGADKYRIHVTKVLAGSFDVTFATTGGTTTEQPVFNFVVTKGSSS